MGPARRVAILLAPKFMCICASPPPGSSPTRPQTSPLHLQPSLGCLLVQLLIAVAAAGEELSWPLPLFRILFPRKWNARPAQKFADTAELIAKCPPILGLHVISSERASERCFFTADSMYGLFTQLLRQ